MFRFRRGRRQARCFLDGVAVRRVALLDERLRWVSLDGLLLDLDSSRPDEHGPASSGRLPDRDAERATELIADADGAPLRRELHTSDGRHFELDAVPITATSGPPLILGIARDLTARAGERHDPEPSRHDDDSFRAVFDAAPGPAALIAGRGESDGRFLRVNRAFAALLGRVPDELELREVTDVTHPDDRALEAAVADDDGTRVVRKRYLHSSGAPVHVEVRVSDVRDRHGVVSGFVNHVVDLDARGASERAMLDVSRLRRDMVSTISHELRTPLTNVQGYLEMIAGEDFGELTGDQRRMIDVARRNAVRLEEFVTDLLMLARLDAAELDPVQHRPVDIGTVVRAAMAAVAGDAEARGQQLLLELPLEPVGVLGDAAHLQRALYSVVSNAITYSDRGGRISVVVRESGAAVAITVTDDGPGIPADELDMLGHRFFRGAAAQTRAIGGTGLGLAITRTILEHHRGSLAISSTPGQGSRFVLSVPVAR